ncbi:nitrate- and nitrite sensing domain-containing protein [Streptomyces sp. NPDC057197]|uniref:sensor histidine kinase n=1 Tax=Streptomyces sp. NPDC057197 TaxID=3346045 RepID=UPI0036354F95
MQKKRPRRTGKQTATAKGPEHTPGTPSAPPVGKGRPKHVRNRLVLAVAVVAAAVAGAGAPSVLDASGRVGDSQDLVTLAGQTQDALALAHALADERDEVTAYAAAGRPRSKAPSAQRGARVDRRADDLRAATGTPGWLRTDLDGIAAVRRSALTGKSTALQTHQAYSAVIADLHRLAGQLAEQMPARAGSGAHALAELDTAVQQAAAARGLLAAALAVPYSTRTVYDPVTGAPTETTDSSKAAAKERDALSAAAQQARIRSDAALAAFRETAPEAARAAYDSTVTGPEVNSAAGYLTRLTDASSLSDADLTVGAAKVDAALTARLDLMRGAESSLYDHRTKDLERLRDDDVTALELRVALLGALLLVAIGIATALARTLTRPLAVLRRGSARLAGAEDPAAEEPIRFTGRNDEYAEVIRSVNALHTQAAALAERVATLETDRKHLVGQRQKMADAREELRAELAEAAARLERTRAGIGSTFVNLALRTLGLVERQLTVIEGLEEREQDPDRLATLFKLDHFATVMRRHSENLLVLAGTEHVQQHAGPVPLVDVVRAAVSEIERYERVRIAALPPHAHVAGFAADDLSHLLAELMENATSFSPPERPVEVSGWLLENGEIMLSVQDEGIGVDGERLTRLNARLADSDPDAPYTQGAEEGLGLGLYVVARLGHRHGVRVQLRAQKQGGTAAVVVVPQPLLAPAPGTAAPAAGTVSLPGAEAEAGSHVLPARTPDGADPLIALAQKAVRQSEAAREKASAESEEAHGKTPAPAGETRERTSPPPGGAREEAPARSEAAAARTFPEESPSETTMELFLPPAPDTPAPDTPAPDTSTADGPAAPGQGSAPGGPAVPAPASETVSTSGTGLVTGAAAEPRPGADHEPGTRAHADASREPDTHAHPGAHPAPGTHSVPSVPSAPAGAPPAAPAAPVPGPAVSPEGAAEHSRAGDDGESLTDKGLPKRTPRITTPAHAPRRSAGSVDAEALRRRLGGFRRGAQAGYRDVEAEIAEQTAQHHRPAPATRAQAGESTGGTVEEASS